MKFKTQIELIEKLKEAAQLGTSSTDNEKDKSVRSFGLGEHGIRFVGDSNIHLLNNTINKLAKTSDLDKTFTVKKITAQLTDLLFELLTENIECKESHVKSFYEYFTNRPILNYEIVGPIYGVTMNENQYDLGDFTIYKTLFFEEILSNRHYYKPQLKDFYFSGIDSEYLISISVKAREQQKAVELANSYLEIFENALTYVVSDLSRLTSPGIFNYKGVTVRSNLAITERGIGINSDAMSLSAVNFPINDKTCGNPTFGNNLLWDLITKENKTDLEKRIINSVDWIGKAISEVDSAKAMTEYVFAIEGLLHLNEGTFVSSSIVNQISEWLAFIIHDTPEKRKEVVKTFREIYQKRSAVTHGGRSDISADLLFSAYALCKQVIILLLVHKDFAQINNLTELKEWVDNKKFG